MDQDSRATPSQTIGPFFHDGLEWAATPQPHTPRAQGEWRVRGRVLDADGAGVSDAMLEVWQPRTTGSESGITQATSTEAGHASIAAGFQRVYTDVSGRFGFLVRQAGSAPAVAHVTVFARGLLNSLRTRLYVGVPAREIGTADELQSVPAERLATLVPSTVDPRERSLEWSVRLQGDGETVFFELVP